MSSIISAQTERGQGFDVGVHIFGAEMRQHMSDEGQCFSITVERGAV